MSWDVVISNLTNPTLLFFVLGIISVIVKSDLEIPPQSMKFISIYLLFSIGFKGGQQLTKAHINEQMIAAFVIGLAVAAFIPIYTFHLLRKRMGVENAAAVAATYGSVSAVTFVAADSFLENSGLGYGSHMVAIMALMEVPAIVVAVYLMGRYQSQERPVSGGSALSMLKHSLTNGSVVVILGSLIIGLISDSKQAEGIKPFTTDIFKGFLALFLLDLGMTTAKRFGAFRTFGSLPIFLGLAFPVINGLFTVLLCRLFIDDVGDRFMIGILAASASYIAVPAAMKIAAPKADPGLFVPMALGLTFPFNITVGMPLLFAVAAS